MSVEEELHLPPGSWLVLNCGSLPNESHCQLVMLAPLDQRDDLIAAGAKHAVDKHGHQDNDELREDVESTIEAVEIEY